MTMKPRAVTPPGLSRADIVRRRWGTLLCFLAQNVIIALAYGSFGPLVPSTEAHFEISRAAAASGLGITAAAVGATAPIAGWLCQRLRLGAVMAFGVVAAATGFLGLAQTGSYNVALAMYALIGVGFCILGVIGPVTFVNRWYRSRRGRMLGLINLPLFYIVAPVATSSLLLHFDRQTALFVFAAILLALAPFTWFVPDKPAKETRALGEAAPAMDAGQQDMTMGMMMRSLPFWLVSLGVAVITAGGTGFLAHVVSFGTDHGFDLEAAAGLVSVYTAVGVVGPMLFGWLADRTGPPNALIVVALAQSLIWLLMPLAGGGQLYILAGLMGLCMTPSITLHGAALGAIFGPAQISKAMGASYIIKLPFLFGLPPLMGLMFERSGSYQLPFFFVAALLVVTVLLFIALSRLQSHRLQPLVAGHGG